MENIFFALFCGHISPRFEYLRLNLTPNLLPNKVRLLTNIFGAMASPYASKYYVFVLLRIYFPFDVVKFDEMNIR